MVGWIDRQRGRQCRLLSLWMSRSDRRNVGCSHTEVCPLFPLLRESLWGWRDYYCDTDDGWLECARFKMSVKGRPVPIALLPNGHTAHDLTGQARRIGLPSNADLPDVGRRRGSGLPPDAGAQLATARFGPAQGSARRHELPTSVPQATASRSAKRSWWRRLASWMRGPA